jgi:microsomal dipeptidase-like Zn-dependent dipeptidase
VAAASAAVVAGAAVAGSLAGRHIVARTERRLCAPPAPLDTKPSERASELHRTLRVVDLHADSLLWGRDLLARGDRGHVDVPRLVEGRVALQALSACVRVPRHLDLDRNADTSDDVLLLAIASGWPPRTWWSPLARALHLAARARSMAERSAGRFRLIGLASELEAQLEAHAADPRRTAGLLTIEGAAPLEGDPTNLGRLAAAGYRMLGLAHFVDNAFAGSAHGVTKGGLTGRGRALVQEAQDLAILVDLAHASSATVDDVLEVATRPVIVSHGGLRSAFDSVRNLPDAQVRGIAATGGLIGVGFWPAVTGGDDVTAIARSIGRAIEVAGPEHVGLGSDWDGAVQVPIDPTGLVHLTDALLAQGLTDDQVRAVMGESALALLGRTLPPA